VSTNGRAAAGKLVDESLIIKSGTRERRPTTQSADDQVSMIMYDNSVCLFHMKEQPNNLFLQYQQNETQVVPKYTGVGIQHNKSISWSAKVANYSNKSGVCIFIGSFTLACDAALAIDEAHKYANNSTIITDNFATINEYKKARSAELTLRGLTSGDVGLSVARIKADAKKKMKEYAAKITKAKKSKKKKSDSLVEEESTQKVSPKYDLLKYGVVHPNPNQIGKSNRLCRVVVDGKVCPISAKKVISGTGKLGKATARASGIEVCNDHSREKEVIKLAIKLQRKRKAEEEPAANPRPKKKANSGGRKKKANTARVSTTTTERTSTKPERAPSNINTFVVTHEKKVDRVELITPPRPESFTAASTSLEPIPDDTIITIPQGDDLEFSQILDEIQGNENIPELIIEMYAQFTVCQKKSNHGLVHHLHTGMPLHSYGIMCHHCQDFSKSGFFLPESLVLNSGTFVYLKNINRMLKHLFNCPHFSNEKYQQLSDITDRTVVSGMNQYTEDSTLKSLQVVLCNVLNDIFINAKELPPMASADGEAKPLNLARWNTKSVGEVGEACIRGTKYCISHQNEQAPTYYPKNKHFDSTCTGCRKHDQLINFDRKFNAKKSYADRECIVFELDKDTFIKLAKDDCEYCGKSECGGIDQSIVGKGYTDENSVSCCKVCNVDKGVKKLKEFQRRVIKRAKWILATYLIGNTKDRAQFLKDVADPDYIPDLPYPRKKSISRKKKGNLHKIYEDHGNFLVDLHFRHCALCGEISNGINRRDSTVGYQYPERLEGCCSQDNGSLANWDMYEFCVQTMKMYNHMFEGMDEGDIDAIMSEGEEYMTVMSREIVGVGSARWTQRRPVKCTYTRLDTKKYIELLFPSSVTMGSLGFYKDDKEYTLSEFKFVTPKEYNQWATNTTSEQLKNIRLVLGIKTDLNASIDTILGE